MSVYAILDRQCPPLHLIFLEVFVRLGRGSSSQVQAASQEKDLTLKFHQMGVARWYYCHMTYSYPNCKGLFEDDLISSHIFIPGSPRLLDPSFTTRGKDKAWLRCGGFKQSPGGWSVKTGQLKHSLTLRGSRNPYLHCFIVTYCLIRYRVKNNYYILTRVQKKSTANIKVEVNKMHII